MRTVWIELLVQTSKAVKIKTSSAHPMDSLTRHCYLKRNFTDAFRSATSRSSAPLRGATHD